MNTDATTADLRRPKAEAERLREAYNYLMGCVILTPAVKDKARALAQRCIHPEPRAHCRRSNGCRDCETDVRLPEGSADSNHNWAATDTKGRITVTRPLGRAIEELIEGVEPLGDDEYEPPRPHSVEDLARMHPHNKSK